MTSSRSRPALRGATAVACFVLAACLSQSSAWTSSGSAGRHRTAARSSRLFLAHDGDRAANLVARRKKRTNKLDVSSSPSPGQRNNKSSRKRQPVTTPVAAQRQELLNHEILTRQQELELGTKVKRANKLRGAIAILIDDKKVALQEEIVREVYNLDAYDEGELSNEALLMSMENPFAAMGLEDFSNLSIHTAEAAQDGALFDRDGNPALSGDEMPLEHHYQNQLERRGRAGIDDLDDRLLTDDDIVEGLDLPGGRAELRRILLEGAFARDTLIRNNIRLVVSIAKRWARQSAKYNREDGARLVTIYAGSSNRPSLDEAIQEGILGLARAADRYDPSRGLRFATYSTHWVTSFVRNCFQDATTGSLRIPSQLHDIKSRYKTLLKSYYDSQKDIPPEDRIAEELGISLTRLRTALRSTQSLVSIDGPLLGFVGPGKGSQAGADSMGGNELLISDTLQCTEARPEDQVELSFLRSCLENAMAAELSPHERDILRLRLGLDDGVSRTVREVVEVCGGSVSVSEVRLAEQRAYKKLRAPYSLQNYKLIAFLDFAGIDHSSLKGF